MWFRTCWSCWSSQIRKTLHHIHPTFRVINLKHSNVGYIWFSLSRLGHVVWNPIHLRSPTWSAIGENILNTNTGNILRELWPPQKTETYFLFKQYVFFFNMFARCTVKQCKTRKNPGENLEFGRRAEVFHPSDLHKLPDGTHQAPRLIIYALLHLDVHASGWLVNI